MSKFKQELIKELKEGTLALANNDADLTIEIIKEAFPKGGLSEGSHKVYHRWPGSDNWHSQHNYPDQSYFDENKITKVVNATDFVDHSKRTDNRFPFVLSVANQQRIISVACDTWKEKLSTSWGPSYMLNKVVIISKYDYDAMRKACTPTQHQLFDDIFGKDVQLNPYKTDDWVTCLSGVISPGPGHKSGHTFQVTDVRTSSLSGKTFLFGAVNGNGVHPEHVRFATDEEIKLAQFPKEGMQCLVSDEKRCWAVRISAGNGEFYAIDGVAKIEWKHYIPCPDLVFPK